MARPTLGFIGVGKVGTTLARLLFARGFVVPVIYSRSTEHAEVLVRAIGTRAVASAEEVIASADLTFLTVPDDALEKVVARLSLTELSGKVVVHTSGVHEASFFR